MDRTSRPRISVLIANYNGSGVIGPCLASVFDQQVSIPFEVIIHDDASSDGSLAEIKSGYPQATLIESNENVGFCVSNNRMANKAQGEYLLLLNNDTVLEPSTLKSLHAYARGLRHFAILSLPQYDADTHTLIDAGYQLDPFFNPIPINATAKDPVAYVMGSLLWIPRELWHEIGGFPDWIGSIAEDMYLCQAARLLGCPTYVLNAPPYYHHVGHSFGGGKPTAGKLNTSTLRRSLSERNKILVMVIIAPITYQVFLLPINLLFLLLEGLVICFARRRASLFFHIYLKAILSALGNFPRARRLRKHLIGLARNRQDTDEQLSFLSQICWRLQKVSLLRRYGIPYISR